MRSTLLVVSRTCGSSCRCDIPYPAAAATATLTAAPSRITAPAMRSLFATGNPTQASLLATTTWVATPWARRRPCRHGPTAVAAATSGPGRRRNGPGVGAGNGGDSTRCNDGNGQSTTTIASSSSNSSSSGREVSVAPLRLVGIPGKGRGVVATRNLSPGELLLVCRPLALVQGPLPAPVQQQQRPQQQQQVEEEDVGADSRRSFQQRSPTAAPAAAAGATRGANARLSSAASAGASGPASAPSSAVAAAAMAVCSEAALVAELQRLQWGPIQAQILAFLYRGAQQPITPIGSRPGPSAAAPDRSAAAAAGDGDGSSSGALPLDLADLTDPWESSWPAGGSAAAAADSAEAPSGAAAGAQAAAPTHGSGLPAEQLAVVVRLNATGLPSDDVLLARLYDKPNLSFIGLWPAHAMLNHSCAPNAVAVVCGSQLVIRCCAPVPPGGEVVITYAGALGLGPLALRRAMLERNHRFRCTCARCTVEEQVPRELAQLWSDIVLLASQQLQPRLVAAATALRASGAATGASTGSSSSSSNTSNSSVDDSGAEGAGSGGGAAAASAAAAALPALLDIRGQVAKCCSLFEETLGQLAPSPQEALWLPALRDTGPLRSAARDSGRGGGGGVCCCVFTAIPISGGGGGGSCPGATAGVGGGRCRTQRGCSGALAGARRPAGPTAAGAAAAAAAADGGAGSARAGVPAVGGVSGRAVGVPEASGGGQRRQ
ncbi:hypothetical protein PLESTF_000738300 [Pleodorina starrii]|nr:hypothetical protein PLESTF_000738300 [Pleodorina starrii]